jgi:2-aminoethylphosphonate-pyruvate transaminase
MPGTIDAPWLLNPGPCNVTQDVRNALQIADSCHREPEYLAMQTDVRKRLLSTFGRRPDQWTSALITGSGTAALEMAISSCVSRTGAMLVISNGVYGERIVAMAEAHRIHTFVVSAPWDGHPNLRTIEEKLHAHPEIEVIAMVHHETTTGLINPVAQVGALALKHGKRLVLDTISGLGGEALDLESVDIAVCTANKLCQGLPGISFCLVRQDFADQIASYPTRSLYLNLHRYIATQTDGGTPFTPAIQIMSAFQQALIELEAETVAGRVHRMANASQRLRAGFERLGLTYYIDPCYHSNTITTLRLPDGMTYETLHRRMRERGYVIYAGQGKLREEAFRIANMGELSTEVIDDVIVALEASLS